MKVVINTCYGGFGLSPEALKEIAFLQGRECHFFRTDGYGLGVKYIPLDIEKDDIPLVTFAFDITNPNEVFGKEERDKDGTYTTQNAKYKLHSINDDFERNDPILVQVVEQLGEKADGRFAELKVVEIPDDVEWEIEEYDGTEWIREVSRRWD